MIWKIAVACEAVFGWAVVYMTHAMMLGIGYDPWNIWVLMAQLVGNGILTLCAIDIVLERDRAAKPRH